MTLVSCISKTYFYDIFLVFMSYFQFNWYW